MKTVLIVGVGRFGRKMIEKLNDLGYEVMAIDRDESRINEILPLVTDAQIGDATSRDFLQTLGVSNYDVCFVTISEDFQSSLVSSSLLKDLGARQVISRAASDLHKEFLLRNGADDVFFPAKQVADWAVMRYAADHVLDYITLDSEYAIYDLTVPEEWYGKTVGALDIRRKYNLNILAVRGNGASMVVSSETVMQQNQTLLVLGKWKDVQKCFKI